MKSDPSRRSVLALGWVSFLTDVSSEMIYPLLPGFLTRNLRAGPAAIGLIEGIAETTASLAKIGSGVWSDRVRRRKPLVLLGYGIATVARPLVAFEKLAPVGVWGARVSGGLLVALAVWIVMAA